MSNKEPMSNSILDYPEICWPASSRAVPPVWHAEIKVEDWDLMLRSVVERLRHAAGDGGKVTPELNGPGSVASLQVIVLECAGALCQLHAALRHDRVRTD
ncbi:hypothetical protein RCH06_001670 [Polaromonas sp. CG_9.5]|nr:hypothetical protein [Polaromonas sp. CG_9.5]